VRAYCWRPAEVVFVTGAELTLFSKGAADRAGRLDAPFDFVAADAYKSIQVADRYTDGIRALVARGKPVAITEFGCATHRGAADLGGHGDLIVEWDSPTEGRLMGAYVRDETGQVTYLRELLDIFTADGVDTAFWCTFAAYHLPHRSDPRRTSTRPRTEWSRCSNSALATPSPTCWPWEPKAAFAALSDAYQHG
jgi:hypothetical protein